MLMTHLRKGKRLLGMTCPGLFYGLLRSEISSFIPSSVEEEHSQDQRKAQVDTEMERGGIFFVSFSLAHFAGFIILVL